MAKIPIPTYIIALLKEQEWWEKRVVEQANGKHHHEAYRASIIANTLKSAIKICKRHSIA